MVAAYETSCRAIMFEVVYRESDRESETWHCFWSRNWAWAWAWAWALENLATDLGITLSKLSKYLKKSWNGSRNASVNRLSKRCQFRAPANVTLVMIAVTHSKRACTRRVRMQSTQLGPQSCLVFGLMCSSTFCELLPTFIVEFCQQNPFQPNICKQHALERQRCELSKRTFRTGASSRPTALI